MIWIVYKNELLKMVKRLASWVTLIFFTFIMFMQFGPNLYQARKDPNFRFGLPDSWSDIIAEDGQIQCIFASMLLILLVANEFQWRTSRQNVIDGMSKDEWFIGKLLLVPTLGVIIYGARVVLGAVLAYAAPDTAPADGPLFTSVHVLGMGGAFLGYLGFASWALFAALAVRNTGPAMGVWFIYFLVEDLVGGLIARIGEGWDQVQLWLPLNAAERLFNWFLYDGAAFQAAVARATEQGRDAPEIGSLSLLAAAVSGWIFLFVSSSYLWFRKRDL